jgi:hypothetical protein
MDVSVMLEQVSANGYRATALVPTPRVAEAPTRDEAVAEKWDWLPCLSSMCLE